MWFSQIQVYLIQWELRIFRQLPLTAVISALVASTLSVFRTRAALQFEILSLRHQLGVLQRSVKKPKLNRFDRCLWAWLFGAWAELSFSEIRLTRGISDFLVWCNNVTRMLGLSKFGGLTYVLTYCCRRT